MKLSLYPTVTPRGMDQLPVQEAQAVITGAMIERRLTGRTQRHGRRSFTKLGQMMAMCCRNKAIFMRSRQPLCKHEQLKTSKWTSPPSTWSSRNQNLMQLPSFTICPRLRNQLLKTVLPLLSARVERVRCLCKSFQKLSARLRHLR